MGYAKRTQLPGAMGSIIGPRFLVKIQQTSWRVGSMTGSRLPGRMPVMGLQQNLLDCAEIGPIAQQPQPAVGVLNHVIDKSAGSSTPNARHQRIVNCKLSDVKGRVTFSYPVDSGNQLQRLRRRAQEFSPAPAGRRSGGKSRRNGDGSLGRGADSEYGYVAPGTEHVKPSGRRRGRSTGSTAASQGSQGLNHPGAPG